MCNYNILISLAIICTLVVGTPVQLDTRITGGGPAIEGQHPYQASVRFINSHLCGGSIIHPEWVLTAASCVYNTPELFLNVFAGTNKLSHGGTQHGVIASYIHEDYNPTTENDDIAVLRVQYIKFNTNTKAVAVDFLPEIPEYKIASLTGWGYTSSPPTFFPESLQHLAVVTTTNEKCSKILKQPIGYNQFCTFTFSGDGACDGDAGGPVVDDVNRKLIGVARAIHYPCGKGLPDVHTKVSSYYLWIKYKCNDCI